MNLFVMIIFPLKFNSVLGITWYGTSDHSVPQVYHSFYLKKNNNLERGIKSSLFILEKLYPTITFMLIKSLWHQQIFFVCNSNQVFVLIIFYFFNIAIYENILTSE